MQLYVDTIIVYVPLHYIQWLTLLIQVY